MLFCEWEDVRIRVHKFFSGISLIIKEACFSKHRCLILLFILTMTNVFSLQNSVNLCLASFCTPRQNLPVIPGISWLPTFSFQSPRMKRTSFFLVLVLGSLVGLHRIIQLQLPQHSGCGIDLLWWWMASLGNKQIILSFLRLQPSTALWTLLWTIRATPFF